EDGWLSRMCAFLFQCSTVIQQGDQRVVVSATKTLEALRPTVTWLSLRALTETQCAQSLYKMLAAGDTTVKTATIDVLQAILSRPYNEHFRESWSQIMLSVLQLDHIELLKNIHLSCNTSADDIDEAKYTLQKKLSEVGSCPDHLENNDADFRRFYLSWEMLRPPTREFSLRPTIVRP
ncbi:nuclear import and export protein Msn5, partial [Aureobasidium melanogenum]